MEIRANRMNRVEPGEPLSFPDMAAGGTAALTPLSGTPCQVADGGVAPTELGGYSASWQSAAGSRRTATVEVVASHYFTLDELAAEDRDGVCDGMTERDLAAGRQAVEEVFERACKRSFTRRVARSVVHAHATGLVELPWVDVASATAAAMDGSPVACELVGDCQARVAADRAVITATYGLETCPDEVRLACIAYALYRLRPDSRPSNAVGQSTDYGFVRFSLAGRDGATGLVEVDAVIKAWSRTGVTVL